jgi:hypothetical protein
MTFERKVPGPYRVRVFFAVEEARVFGKVPDHAARTRDLDSNFVN